jgi:hypothetical protein
MHEHQLRQLLLASQSIAQYLEAIRGAGFRVQEEPPTTSPTPY